MKSFFQKRQTQFALYATIYIGVVVAILGLINFLADRYNKSFDTTSNKRYSLSDQTEKIVKNLNKDVVITYFDEERGFQAARDLLGRYQNLSPKLKVNYVNYKKDPIRAKSAGIRTVPITLVEAGLKRDEAKSVTEEELTGALIRVIKDGERNICFITGLGERSPDESNENGMSAAKEALEKSNYKVRAVSLLENPEIPKDCTVVIAAGPKRDYPAALAEGFKKYVEGGGKAMFLVDPPIEGARGAQETSANPELWKVLNGWGVSSSDEVVLDLSGYGRLSGLGPEVPLVNAYEAHAIVRDLKETASAMPLARPLEIKSAGGNVTVEKLFSSMPNSFAKSTKSLQGEIRIDRDKDKKGPFALGAAGSYKTGQSNNSGRFVVIGTASFAANSGIRLGANRDLFANSVNWLAADEDLISIRPKDPEDNRIQATARQVSTLGWTALVFLPLAVVLTGVSVWWRRR